MLKRKKNRQIKLRKFISNHFLQKVERWLQLLDDIDEDN